MPTDPAHTTTLGMIDGFLHSCVHHPSRPALEVDGASFTYTDLLERAAVFALTILKHKNDDTHYIGVFAHRSATAFAGVLGALLSGHGYVPLNMTYPVDRTRIMLNHSGCSIVIVDERSETQLSELLAGIDRSLLLVLPHKDDTSDLRSQFPKHSFVGALELDEVHDTAKSFDPTLIPHRPEAYVLYTSGSTGAPKGVSLTRANVDAFVSAAQLRYNITHEDRLSQCFDMTFDLSVFDMFMAWTHGACLCCPTAKEVVAPGKFVRDAGLTVWFSVPSVATFMQQFGMVKPDRYPLLRWSLFCGEALPVALSQVWQKAAPNSVIENLYGPTELTIACTVYRFDENKTPDEAELGTVPIGEPFHNMEAIVVDEHMKPVAPGEAGELICTGPQLATGYLHDPEKTSAAFVRISGRSETFYRTGDLVRNPAAGKPMTFLGRVDNQIKMRGFRIEPGEIEVVLIDETGAPTAVAVGWPITPNGAGGIVAFVETDALDVASLDERVKLRLPPYMVPREYRSLAKFPRNANGKVDRKALIATLENKA